MPVISPAPWNEAVKEQNRRVVAAPYRLSLSKQSCGEDNGCKGLKPRSGNRSEGRNKVFATLTRGLLAAALLVFAASNGRAQPDERSFGRLRRNLRFGSRGLGLRDLFLRDKLGLSLSLLRLRLELSFRGRLLGFRRLGFGNNLYDLQLLLDGL